MKIFNKLKLKRQELGLTQKYLANKIGMSEISYNRKEQGKREFTYSELCSLVTNLELKNHEIIEIFFKN